MGFDPANIIALGIGVTAFFCTIMCIFLFATAYKERPARMLGYLLLFYALWAWFGFAFHLTNDLWLEREFRVISILCQIIGQIFTVEYAYAYLEERRPLILWEKILYWFLMAGNITAFGIAFSDALSTQLIARDVIATIGHPLAPLPGPFFLYFMFYFLLLGTACGAIMLRRVIHEHGHLLNAGIIMTTCIVAGYYMGSTGYLIWYGMTGYYTLFRGLSIPLFILAAFYTVKDYRLFNARIAIVEIFIFAMWGFLGWRVLVDQSIQSAIPDAAILVSVIILGLFLIRNVIRELAAKFSLEEASEELRVLNGSLESKVVIRTKELAQSERHIAQVVEYLPVGLIEIEANGTIVRINDAAGALFSIKNDEVVGTPLTAHPILAGALGTTMHSGSFDAHIDGASPRDLEIAVAPLSLEHGNGFIIIIRDVTERRTLERAKNEFVTSAAGQLRTPLQLIKKTFDALAGEPLEGTVKEVVARGASGIANMEHIAEGLGMIAKTTEGMSKYTFVTADIHPLLDSVVAMVTPLAQMKKITLTIDIAATLPILSFDRERIGFAVQNLLDNAIKYTPSGGMVTLHVHQDGANAVIDVIDTGIGIAEIDQGRLFEKFFRAKKATEMAADGSGLGLAIAKSIITAHGGEISVASEEGKGSTFTIILPEASTPS